MGTCERVDKEVKAVFTENKNSSEYSDTYGQTIKRWNKSQERYLDDERAHAALSGSVRIGLHGVRPQRV